eukprot:6455681-Amphidinium_carterae.1
MITARDLGFVDTRQQHNSRQDSKSIHSLKILNMKRLTASLCCAVIGCNFEHLGEILRTRNKVQEPRKGIQAIRSYSSGYSQALGESRSVCLLVAKLLVTESSIFVVKPLLLSRCAWDSRVRSEAPRSPFRILYSRKSFRP